MRFQTTDIVMALLIATFAGVMSHMTLADTTVDLEDQECIIEGLPPCDQIDPCVVVDDSCVYCDTHLFQDRCKRKEDATCRHFTDDDGCGPQVEGICVDLGGGLECCGAYTGSCCFRRTCKTVVLVP